MHEALESPLGNLFRPMIYTVQHNIFMMLGANPCVLSIHTDEKPVKSHLFDRNIPNGYGIMITAAANRIASAKLERAHVWFIVHCSSFWICLRWKWTLVLTGYFEQGSRTNMQSDTSGNWKRLTSSNTKSPLIWVTCAFSHSNGILIGFSRVKRFSHAFGNSMRILVRKRFHFVCALDNIEIIFLPTPIASWEREKKHVCEKGTFSLGARLEWSGCFLNPKFDASSFHRCWRLSPI